MNPILELIEMGLLVRFRGPDGVERIRPTPAGARAAGEHATAELLELCAAGNHQPHPNVDAPYCVCGETRAR